MSQPTKSVAKVKPLIKELKYSKLFDCFDLNWTNHMQLTRRVLFLSHMVVSSHEAEYNLAC